MATAAERKRREERVKLFTSGLANLGTAFIVGGVVGPLLPGRPHVAVLLLAVGAGAAFHLAAQGFMYYVAEEAG